MYILFFPKSLSKFNLFILKNEIQDTNIHSLDNKNC